MHRLGRILVLQRVDEVILQIILAQPVILGVMPKERGESLSLEHEAGVVGVGRDSAEGVFGAGEVEVFLRADGEFDVLIHVVVVVGIIVAASIGVVGHGCCW